MYSLIAPMLTGKSSIHDDRLIDVDSLRDDAKLSKTLGQPKANWSRRHWDAWNSALAEQLNAKLQPMRGDGILLVHDGFWAAALHTIPLGIIIIPTLAFEERCRQNPERAALARKNRKEVLEDQALAYLPIFPFIEVALMNLPSRLTERN